jgi:hypothetical protein
MNAVKEPPGAGPVDQERLSTVEILKRTPLHELGETVSTLKQRRSNREIREAMIYLIATAPLSHFATLKTVFMTHCAEPWH